MHTILHTEASPGWGGQEIRILKECLGLQSRGYRPLLAVNPRSPLLQRARESGLDTYPIPFSYSRLIPCLRALIRLIRNEKVELINTHSSIDAWIAGILGRIMGLPLIRTRHLSTPVKGKWNAYILYNLLADRVVTTCENIIKPLSKQAHLAKGKCLSIPTGMNLDNIEYSPEEVLKYRQKWGFKPEDIVIGTCCIMRRWKGVEFLLRAADLLKKQPHLRFLLVGGGVSLPYFIDLHRQLDLGDRVIFTDHLEEPLKAIACMDIFSLLSTGHEGVSQASLQAAYLKKPLITTLCGGLPEVCIEGKTGVVVPYSDEKSVARAILYLAKYPVTRQRFGQAAHQLVVEKFSFTHTLDMTEGLLKALLKQGD